MGTIILKNMPVFAQNGHFWLFSAQKQYLKLVDRAEILQAQVTTSYLPFLENFFKNSEYLKPQKMVFFSKILDTKK